MFIVLATNEYQTSLLALAGFQQGATAGLPVMVAFKFVPCVQPKPTEIEVALQIKSLPGTWAKTEVLVSERTNIKTGIRIRVMFFIFIKIMSLLNI